MRIIEFCVSDGEGTLLDHGYFEWSPATLLDLIEKTPKGSAIMFEELDPSVPIHLDESLH